jgi:hypothetical protein
MRRRAYLATGLAAVSSVTGCLGGDSSDGTNAPDGTAAATGSPADAGDGTAGGAGTASPGSDGEYPVPRSELKRGAPEDAIPAIVDPVFAPDWSGITLNIKSQFGGEREIEPRLTDGDRIIGVERGGEARAYPLRVLNWHEVCNDSFHGPLLVTYCPLCRTGLSAVRRVNDRETTFGVSGLLWKSNLVMYDELTDSRWSQVTATAIRGEKAGTELDLVPSAFTSWGEWRDVYPDTTVLVPPPESSTVRGNEASRNYNENPYSEYDTMDQVGIGRSDYDDRLHPKTIVVGVSDGEGARAYPLDAVRTAGVVNDAVGDLHVVVTTDASGSLVAYDRTVDGAVLEFRAADSETLRSGGSTWRRSTGEALDGPHKDVTLERANDLSPLFWFSWADVHPDSEIYET